MRKSLLALLVTCSFGVLTAVAQDSSSTMNQSAPSQNTGAMQSPGQSGSTNAQSGKTNSLPPEKDSATSNGAMQSGNGTDLVAEGCLVKEQSAYYVQPESGGARTQLSPSRSLDAYVGQHVQVKGHNDASSDSTATAASGATSAMSSNQGGELSVTAIKVVSASCSPATGSMPRH